ncbi:MAG: alpha/beta hydrolase [Planctomycetes bacterium]|nr:alpha/beta hydrolase [Planctomycetota bacterium]
MDRVILLHGLWRTRGSMALLAWRLRRRGFETHLFGYPSRHATVEEHARALAEFVRGLEQSRPAARTHFVTHSLGGMVVRYAYTHEGLPRTGRFVMLAPPSRGAWAADRLISSAFGRWFMGVAGSQLGTDGVHLRCGLPPVEFAVLTGGTGRNRGRARWIPGDNDGRVRVEEAWLPGAAEFRVIPCSHTFIMNLASTTERVISFLSRGACI